MSRRGRFLIVVWEGGGNVSSTLALGRRLDESGHLVRVLSARSLQDRVEAAGLSFRRFEETPEFGSHLGRPLDWPYLSDLWFGPGPGKDLESEVAREGTDILLVDYSLFGALAAAERSGLPAAAMVHTLYHLNVEQGAPFTPWWQEGLPRINETRRGLGLTSIDSAPQLWDAMTLVLAFAPIEFDRAMSRLPANVHYVGPVFDPPSTVLPEALSRSEQSGPLVLVSLSTTYQNQEPVLQRILDAMEGLPIRGLVTTGPAVPADALRAPANTSIYPYFDHRDVLPHAAAVVTHAGLSTVMAALAHGVPLLCLPMGRDQNTNAERVVACGAGRTLSVQAPAEGAIGLGTWLPPSAEQIRGALLDLLQSPTYRQGAQRMAKIIAGYGNGAKALALLESLLPLPARQP